MTNLQRALLVLLILALLFIVPLGRSIMFTVNEREQAMVLRFGEPVASYTEPGLRFKVPLVDEVRRLPKTYQFWTGAGGEILVDLPTADGKKIEVTPWAVWRITDPEQFIKELRTVPTAESRVKDFVRSEMRDVITANVLAEVVRSTDRKLTYTFQAESPSGGVAPQPGGAGEGPAVPGQPPTRLPSIRQAGVDEKIESGREKLVQKIKETVERRLASADQPGAGARGIELVDVGIAKIDFVDVVREAAFERLIALMASKAQENEAEGERRKTEILNQANAEVQKIEGEGKGEANKIRGEAEARVIQMYADAIRQTGDFYGFVRTLEAYKEVMKGNTRLVLTTDSQLFQLLKKVPPAEAQPPPSSESGSTEKPPAETAAPATPAEKPATEPPPGEKPAEETDAGERAEETMPAEKAPEAQS